MLAQDGSALVLARATDTPSSPAQEKGEGKGKGEGKKGAGGWMKTRGFSPLSPNDATYFVACFICTIKRRPIRLSYPLSSDFCPDGIFHQSFTLACLFARVTFHIPIKTWLCSTRATEFSVLN